MSVTGKVLRCLIVEDSEDDALLLLSELHTGGFDVTWERVETAEAMRAALKRLSWDIVISDHQMPHFSGPAALELLHASGHDLPFIIVSGEIGEEVAVAAMRLGAHDYLMKGKLARLAPAVDRELRDAIERRQRKQAELRLKAAVAEAERFREALDHVSAHIYMKDLQSRYIYANQSTLKLFGCAAGELVGCDDARFFPPDTVKRLRAIDAKVFRGEQTTEEIEVVAAAGGRRVYWEVKTPIYAGPERKTPIGLLGVSTDITQIKDVEVTLQQQTVKLRARNEALSRFNAAAVGRELRMVELKQEVNELCAKLGEPPRFRVVTNVVPASPEKEPPP